MKKFHRKRFFLWYGKKKKTQKNGESTEERSICQENIKISQISFHVRRKQRVRLNESESEKSRIWKVNKTNTHVLKGIFSFVSARICLLRFFVFFSSIFFVVIKPSKPFSHRYLPMGKRKALFEDSTKKPCQWCFKSRFFQSQNFYSLYRFSFRRQRKYDFLLFHAREYLSTLSRNKLKLYFVNI